MKEEENKGRGPAAAPTAMAEADAPQPPAASLAADNNTIPTTEPENLKEPLPAAAEEEGEPKAAEPAAAVEAPAAALAQ